MGIDDCKLYIVDWRLHIYTDGRGQTGHGVAASKKLTKRRRFAIRIYRFPATGIREKNVAVQGEMDERLSRLAPVVALMNEFFEPLCGELLRV